MRLFGMKAYRRVEKIRRGEGIVYQSLERLRSERADDVWVADFTYIPYRGKFLYLATVMDVFTREIVGMAVQANHTTPLVLQALFAAAANHPRPTMFHSDNGREYGSKANGGGA